MTYAEQAQAALQPTFTEGQVLGETRYQPRREFGPSQYLTSPDPNATAPNMAAQSMLESVIPTSWNLRNRALQEAFNIERTPIGGLAASRNADAYIRKLIPTLQKSRSALAARGLLGGGASDRLNRSIFSDLSQGMQAATSSGYEADRKQRTLFMDMLDSLYKNDLDLLTSTRNYVDPRAYQEAHILKSQNDRANTQRWVDMAKKVASAGLTWGLSGAAPDIVQTGAKSGWGEFIGALL